MMESFTGTVQSIVNSIFLAGYTRIRTGSFLRIPPRIPHTTKHGYLQQTSQ